MPAVAIAIDFKYLHRGNIAKILSEVRRDETPIGVYRFMIYDAVHVVNSYRNACKNAPYAKFSCKIIKLISKGDKTVEKFASLHCYSVLSDGVYGRNPVKRKVSVFQFLRTTKCGNDISRVNITQQ